MIVIEREGTIGRRFEIVSADASTWISLVIHWREHPRSILQDPHRASSGTIERKVILLASPIVVESKRLVGTGFEVVPTNPISRAALSIDRKKCVCRKGCVVEVNLAPWIRVAGDHCMLTTILDEVGRRPDDGRISRAGLDANRAESRQISVGVIGALLDVIRLECLDAPRQLLDVGDWQ